MVAAFEPYLLSLSDNALTLWDRRDGRSLKVVTLDGSVFGVMVALKDIRAGRAAEQKCNEIYSMRSLVTQVVIFGVRIWKS